MQNVTIKKLVPLTDSKHDNSNEQINEHMKTRITYAKQENNWKYINVSLIKKWKIKRVPNLTDITVLINCVKIKCSSKNDDYFIFDFPKLRADWFELMGESERECDLIALEEACMYNQLCAINHFSQVPKELMKGTLFTDQLMIFIIPQWKERTHPSQHANKLEIEEIYFVSDIHKETYQASNKAE
jgi:hypothetical protein